MTEPDLRLDVSAYDAVSPAAALEVVRPLCASPAWLDAMVARRPLRTLERALDISDAIISSLSWPQVEKAATADPSLEAAAERGGDDRVQRQLALRAAVKEHVRDKVAGALK